MHVQWLIAECGLLVFYYIDSMWSASVDVAYHYALAFRISERWTLANLYVPSFSALASYDPSLGEMNIYPRLSYIIVAVLGTFVNSTFLGLQITALMSLAFLWLGALLILNSLQPRLAITAILIFTAIFLLNAISIKLDIHGHEIVGNFFFSHFVGQAALFVGMSIAIYLEKTKGKIVSFIFLTLLTFINASIHLLPAVEMLGLACGLLFAYVFIEIDPTRTGRV